MIESLSQTGHRRKMILSQFCPVGRKLVRPGGNGDKEDRTRRGSASAFDQPRSSSEAEPRLLKKTQLKENISSYLHAVRASIKRLAGYLRCCNN